MGEGPGRQAMIVGSFVLLGLLVLGCFEPDILSGGFLCKAKDPRCPKGFHCEERLDICIRNGETLDASLSSDMDGQIGVDRQPLEDVGIHVVEGSVVCSVESDLPGYCFIPAGTFLMGSPEGELGSTSLEHPQHEVTISRDFYLKATEVTQKEWLSLVGYNPSDFTGCGEGCPVETVNWWEAVAYCNDKSDASGLVRCYELLECGDEPPGHGMQCKGVTFSGLDCPGFRLPTEAEWEYSARAGSITAFYVGVITEFQCAVDPSLSVIGWYCGNSDDQTHPVALKQSNIWGLYDMSGNVWEWVWDYFEPSYYDLSPSVDPMGPEEGSIRAGRGGDWEFFSEYCRSAARAGSMPKYSANNLGFRPCKSK